MSYIDKNKSTVPADLREYAVNAFCITLAAEVRQDGASDEEIAKMVSWVSEDLSAREVVMVKNDQRFQHLMALANSNGNYEDALDRLSEKFICANLDDGKRVLLFLPLGWGYLQMPAAKMVRDDKGRARGLIKPTDDPLVECFELDCYYEISIRPGEDSVVSIARVTDYENNCIRSFDYTAEMVRSGWPVDCVINDARVYMNQNYPNWRNPMAYWD